jgi:hypothetical protein
MLVNRRFKGKLPPVKEAKVVKTPRKRKTPQVRLTKETILAGTYKHDGIIEIFLRGYHRPDLHWKKKK